MKKFQKVKSSIQNVFLAAGLAYMGLIPQETPYDPEQEVTANETQLKLLEKVRENYDFVVMGDTDHESPYVTLYTLQPDVLNALKKDDEANISTEYGIHHNTLLWSGTKDPDFEEKCKNQLIGSWLQNDEAESEICKSFGTAIDDPQLQFFAVDQRFAGDSRPFGRGQIIISKLFEAQEYLFGKTDGGAPTMMLATTGLYFLNDEPLVNDVRTVDAITDYGSGGKDSGVIIYGAKHFQYKEDDNGQPMDMKSLLEEKGYSVCVVNIHESEKTRKVLNEYVLDEDNPADIDIVVLPSDDHPVGIHVMNPELDELYTEALDLEVAEPPNNDLSV
ncbi:MAG: hypothetical protein ACRBDL_08510 [Alphaproteobacteria bacterium]